MLKHYRKVFRLRRDAENFYGSLNIPRRNKQMYLNFRGYYVVAWQVEE